MENIDKYYDLMGRHLTGELSDADRKDLDAWLEADAENQKVFEEITGVWKMTEEQDSEIPFQATEAWGSVEQKLGWDEQEDADETPVRQLSPNRWWIGIAAAAAIVLLIGYNWLYQNGSTPAQQLVFETKATETRELVLPDGSRVWLNENSRLSYAASFEERSIQMEGEAFFDVTRMEDRPFQIVSGEARTKVLGTSFNIRAYPTENKIELTVETGKVSFGKNEEKSQPIFIPAGESAVLVKKEEKVEKVETKISNATSWKNQKLDFDNTSMEEVIQSLERYFNIDIEVANRKILNCRARGSYNNPSLDNMFEVLKFMLYIDVQEQGDQYILSGEGC